MSCFKSGMDYRPFLSLKDWVSVQMGRGSRHPEDFNSKSDMPCSSGRFPHAGRGLQKNFSIPWKKLWFFSCQGPLSLITYLEDLVLSVPKTLMQFLHPPYMPPYWPCADLSHISQSWANKSWQIPKLLIESLSLYWLFPSSPLLLSIPLIFRKKFFISEYKIFRCLTSPLFIPSLLGLKRNGYTLATPGKLIAT